MADLVRKHKLNIAGHTGKKAGRSRFVVDAFADSDQIEGLRSEGYKVDVREDVQEAGKKRQLEVGSSAVRALTRNVATATHYLNVNDVENSLAAAASGPNAGFTRLLSSPTKPGKDESATPSRSRMALKAAVRASTSWAASMRENRAAAIFSSILSNNFARPFGRRAALLWAASHLPRQRFKRSSTRRIFTFSRKPIRMAATTA